MTFSHRENRCKLQLDLWDCSLPRVALAQTDPLPSWNGGAAKKAIVEFVKATNMQGSSLNAAGIYYYPLQAMKPLKEMGNLSPLHN